MQPFSPTALKRLEGFRSPTVYVLGSADLGPLLEAIPGAQVEQLSLPITDMNRPEYPAEIIWDATGGEQMHELLPTLIPGGIYMTEGKPTDEMIEMSFGGGGYGMTYDGSLIILERMSRTRHTVQ